MTWPANPNRHLPINQYQKTGKYLRTLYVDQFTKDCNVRNAILRCCQRGDGRHSVKNYLWGFLKDNPDCNNIESYCNDTWSYGEKMMYKILYNANSDFIVHYTPSWGQRREYDFYVKSKALIIEINGSQHYREATRYKRTLAEEQANDVFKKQLAENNGIKHYIYIDASRSQVDFIKESIIESGVLEILGITEVDWKDIYQFSYKGMDATIIELWNNGMISSRNIADKLKIKISAVRNVLWRFDSMLTPKFSEISKIKFGVIQYTLDRKEIARYESSGEAAKALGKSGSSNIRRCCLGQQAEAYGYVWRYQENEYIQAPKDRLKTESNREVNAYDRNQNFIGKYDDARSASNALNINITNIRKACERIQTRAKDYTFRYADDCGDIVPGQWIDRFRFGQVIMLDANKQYLQTFKNSKEAKKFLNITGKSDLIANACSNKTHKYGDNFFYYEEDYNKLINNKNMEVA